MLNVLYTMLVTGLTVESRKEIDDLLAGPVAPEEWGVGPDAVAGQQAMFALVGGAG